MPIHTDHDARRRRRSRSGALLTALALLTTFTVAGPTPAALAAGEFTAEGSINQVYTYGHRPAAVVHLLAPDGEVIGTGLADAQGAYLFKGVAEGGGYRVSAGDAVSDELTVTEPFDHPDPSFYESAPDLQLQDTGVGHYGYITTRDGTTLSISVAFPTDDPPPPGQTYPVVVNYSGYDPSNPAHGVKKESLVYALNGYIAVGVNLRGTGCSGGAFDFLEPPQWSDGYDVIETLANQPWSNGDVGLVGISYAGFTQLPVAATRPPHLRAITPLSPFDDAYRSLLYPGGMLNDGFALEWAREREDFARPLAEEWVQDRVIGGDEECGRNQVLRLQSRPLRQSIVDHPYADEEFSHLEPQQLVPRIEVPTFLAVQFQDDKTGGRAVTLAGLFDPATKLHAGFTNGSHIDSIRPDEFVRTMAFVDFYVGRRVPVLTPHLAGQMAGGLSEYFGASGADLAWPPNPWAGITDYAAALAWFEATASRVTVGWENGGIAGREGLPFTTATTRHPAWPIPGTVSEAHYLQPDGLLGPTPPALPPNVERARSAYRYNPAGKRWRTFDGVDTWDLFEQHPDVHWDASPEGEGLTYLTEPFPATAAYAGSGSVDLWLRSNAIDTDVEVVLTEVRPDGDEVYIQSGRLRASQRHLDAAATTDLLPSHTQDAADARPLPAGRFEPVRVQIFPFAHVIRPGSRLRLSIEAPGGNLPDWGFDTLEPVRADGGLGLVVNEIGHATLLPSRVVLPRLPEAASPDVPVAAPSCHVDGVTPQSPSLRLQPCRPYVAPRVPTRVAATRLPRRALAVTWVAPAGPEVPTGYRVNVVTTGETIDVPAGATAAIYAGGKPRVRYAFTVQARYGDVIGPPSDASRRVRTRPGPSTGPADVADLPT